VNLAGVQPGDLDDFPARSFAFADTHTIRGQAQSATDNGTAAATEFIANRRAAGQCSLVNPQENRQSSS
jgi:hypothetical protein